MKILYFDTETTGFLAAGKDKTDPAQPRIVQLAALLKEDGKVLAQMNFIIKPDGWTIPEDAARVHGISTEHAEANGIPIAIALSVFNRLAGLADLVVAHNFAYDDTVVQAEFARIGRVSPHVSKNSFDTMLASTEIVKLPSKRGGYKFPKLIEAYKFFFGKEFDGAHNAMVDVDACREIHEELVRRKT